MTSPSGAEDAAESEDPGGGGKERYGGHSTKEEVHEQQRKEEELVQDEEEGKDCMSSVVGHISHLSSPVCVHGVHVQWKKAEEKLEKELLEAEASESKEKKIKLVSPMSQNTNH